jgi:cell division transport system ATP-binding protein
MITLCHVSKSYGAHAPALVDLTLSVDKGEFVFITGPSGAGKSTLLRLILSAERPTEGQLMVCGRNTARLHPGAIPYLRRNMGVVFQDFKLLSTRTVEENVAIVLQVLGLPRREVARRTAARLRQVGLAHKAHHLPPTLSGGEQQRVAIARALVGDPQIVLADEPTGNLDRRRSDEVMTLLAEAHARGATVVVATHDEALLRHSPHRVIALERGRAVA